MVRKGATVTQQSSNIEANSKRPTLEVVAAIIHKTDGERNCVFATQRGYGNYAGYWEFPGGKTEEGEAPEQALVREIREELNCAIQLERHFCTVEYDYDEFHLCMQCYLCALEAGKDGIPHLLEHSAAKWVDRATIDEVKWLPSDWQVVDALKEHLL